MLFQAKNLELFYVELLSTMTKGTSRKVFSVVYPKGVILGNTKTSLFISYNDYCGHC